MKWIAIHVREDTYKKIRLLAGLKGVAYGQVVAELVDKEFSKTGIDIEDASREMVETAS